MGSARTGSGAGSGAGRRGRPGDDPAGGLTGGGPSQLGVDGSMRARDVSRPSEDQLGEAERTVQVSYRPRGKPVSPPGEAEDGGSARTP